jgi:hypothetical protein
MASLSRQNFIKKATVSAAAAGALATVPGFSLATEPAFASESDTRMSVHAGPVLAHIRNVATGEIAVLFGTREVVIHDVEVVNRLLRAAQ